MGVPGFFAWLLRYYKNNKIITQTLEKRKVDILYLDANCLFHPQCFKILDENPHWKSSEKLENKMMKRIIKYIDFLIESVNPAELYIAVDGVAPMAKMNQQRKRRFRSRDDMILNNSIKERYGKPITNPWSNTVITPGTSFMEKLNKILVDYIATKNIPITYSSYHTPGEGEHKILADIRKNNSKRTCVIYGLDADLIFLALSCNKENIFLMREVVHFGKSKKHNNKSNNNNNNNKSNNAITVDVSEDLNYVSIDLLRHYLNKMFYEKIKKKSRNKVRLNTSIDFTPDFIMLMYLLGNDFLPHIPSIDIKVRGIDYLIDCYISTYIHLKTNLLKNASNQHAPHINNMFFGMLLKRIANGEEYYFREILPRHKQKSATYQKCRSSDPYEIEVYNLKFMKNMNIEDPIQLSNDYTKDRSYKPRYYEHYYGAIEHQSDYINQLCDEYLRGVKWTTEYYFNKCASWRWQYQYSHGPFISDISRYFSTKKINLNTFTFDNHTPISPCTQLLAVLGPYSKDLLPKSYQKLVTDESPISDLYPIKTTLDMIHKDQYWKCIPLIPVVDINRIINCTKGLKLTKAEKVRNKTSINYVNKPSTQQPV